MEKPRAYGTKGKGAKYHGGHKYPEGHKKASPQAAQRRHPKHMVHKHAEHKAHEPAKKEAKTAGKPQAGGKESAVKFDERQFAQTGALKIYEVLEYPLVSEKAVNMIEGENKLVFVVNGKATRGDVRKAVETMYNVKVVKVNICRDMKARKKAFVRLDKAFKAEDLATKLGVL